MLSLLTAVIGVDVIGCPMAATVLTAGFGGLEIREPIVVPTGIWGGEDAIKGAAPAIGCGGTIGGCWETIGC